ncbi:MAG: transcription antitermination factor NusB [Actinomycetota bacterium]
MSPSSRSVAMEVIRRVIDEGAYSNRLLPPLLARSGLQARDRAFATELAYGTLRHRLWLDHAIEGSARRPIDRMSPGARHALRLGAYQVLVAGVAPHAAVSETVELAGGRERGFVNAVLRRLVTEAPRPPEGEDESALSIRTGLSRWAVRELRHLLGDEAEAAASALATRAPLCLRARDPAGLADRLRETGVEVTHGTVDPSCLLVQGGDPARLPGYGQGAFAIQDQASAFVVRVLDPPPGARVADVCAAPGGKAVFAASLVGPGGVVVAADVHERRARVIRDEAARQGVSPLLLVQDAAHPALAAGSFDRVLVDAPCSGLGSARRRPELLWRGSKDGLTELAARQLAVTTAARELLRPGGLLVYSVCTYPRAETDAVVDTLLARCGDLRPVPTAGPDGIAERHRLWPHRHGADGMFVAAFERVS